MKLVYKLMINLIILKPKVIMLLVLPNIPYRITQNFSQFLIYSHANHLLFLNFYYISDDEWCHNSYSYIASRDAAIAVTYDMSWHKIPWYDMT